MPAAAAAEKATYMTPCFRDLQREISWLRGRVTELEAWTAALGSDLDASQKAVHNLTIDCTVLREESCEHQTSATKFMREAKDLAVELRSAQESAAASAQEVASLRDELRKAGAREAERERALAAANSARVELSEGLGSEKREREAAERAAARAACDTAEASERSVTLRNKLDQARATQQRQCAAPRRAPAQSRDPRAQTRSDLASEREKYKKLCAAHESLREQYAEAGRLLESAADAREAMSEQARARAERTRAHARGRELTAASAWQLERGSREAEVLVRRAEASEARAIAAAEMRMQARC